jgi:ketosteroid isomerase-like protein
MRVQKLLLGICLVCPPAISAAQTNASPALAEEGKILALEKKWTDAYKQHSINTVTSLLAEDFTITVEDGRTFGKIGYISHTADNSIQVDVAEESDLRVHMHGNNVAIVTGAYHEVGTSRGKRYEYHDRLTDVWLKVDGQWQLIAAQYSVPVQQ